METRPCSYCRETSRVRRKPAKDARPAFRKTSENISILPVCVLKSVLAVSEIVRLAGNADTARLRPQVFECEIERRRRVIRSGVYVAVPEKVTEAKSLGELKDDKSGFARRLRGQSDSCKPRPISPSRYDLQENRDPTISFFQNIGSSRSIQFRTSASITAIRSPARPGDCSCQWIF